MWTGKKVGAVRRMKYSAASTRLTLWKALKSGIPNTVGKSVRQTKHHGDEDVDKGLGAAPVCEQPPGYLKHYLFPMLQKSFFVSGFVSVRWI